MNTSIEQELTSLENQYWQAIKDKNFDAAMRLTDNPCIVTGAQGVASIDRKGFEAMMNESPWTLDSYDLSEVKVRPLSDDVAIVAYKVKEQVTMEGKALTVEAADSSTWVRRDGRWVCALHTESLAGDPFGRDKTKETRSSTSAG